MTIPVADLANVPKPPMFGERQRFMLLLIAPAVAALIFTFVFCLYFGYFAYDFTETSFAVNARSDMGRILLWPWMATMPVACVLIAIAAFVRFRRGGNSGDGDAPQI